MSKHTYRIPEVMLAKPFTRMVGSGVSRPRVSARFFHRSQALSSSAASWGSVHRVGVCSFFNVRDFSDSPPGAYKVMRRYRMPTAESHILRLTISTRRSSSMAASSIVVALLLTLDHFPVISSCVILGVMPNRSMGPDVANLV